MEGIGLCFILIERVEVNRGMNRNMIDNNIFLQFGLLLTSYR